MGPIIVENRRLAFALGEKLEYAPHLRPGAAAGQLAVAKGAGAAFAEEVIAFRIKRPAGVEAVDIVNALAHAAAAFEDQRLVAFRSQKKARDESRGARANDDGPMRERRAAARRHHERRFFMLLDAQLAM